MKDALGVALESDFSFTATGLTPTAFDLDDDPGCAMNGQWEFVFGAGNERAETNAGQRKMDWKKVKL